MDVLRTAFTNNTFPRFALVSTQSVCAQRGIKRVMPQVPLFKVNLSRNWLGFIFQDLKLQRLSSSTQEWRSDFLSIQNGTSVVTSLRKKISMIEKVAHASIQSSFYSYVFAERPELGLLKMPVVVSSRAKYCSGKIIRIVYNKIL